MGFYLVTGGAGFIGSNIVRALTKRGDRVRVLDNFSTGKRENIISLSDHIELVEGDVRSYHIVREAMNDVDFVLHQAALPSVPRSINDPITTNEVNVTGTINILNAAKDMSLAVRGLFGEYGAKGILDSGRGNRQGNRERRRWHHDRSRDRYDAPHGFGPDLHGAGFSGSDSDGRIAAIFRPTVFGCCSEPDPCRKGGC